MSYNDRRSFDPTTVPDGCQDASQEFESIKWIVNSVNCLERLPSCKRRDALKTVLTAMLEDPTLPTPSECNLLKGETLKLRGKCELLNTQVIELKEQVATYDSELEAFTRQQRRETLLAHCIPVPRFVFWGWLVGSMLGIWMIYQLIHRVTELGAT